MAKYYYDYGLPVAPEFERLIDKYPRLFHGRMPRSHSYLVIGWAALIDRALAEIDKALSDEECDDFQITQIKEKFGSLRIHAAMGDLDGEVPEDWPKDRTEARFEKMMQLVPIFARAEREAECTCEFCGEPGRLRLLHEDPQVAPQGFLEVETGSPSGVRGGGLSVVCDFHGRHWREARKEKRISNDNNASEINGTNERARRLKSPHVDSVLCKFDPWRSGS